MGKLTKIKGFASVLALGTFLMGTSLGFFLRQCFTNGKCQWLNWCAFKIFESCAECWGWLFFTGGLVITVVGLMLVLGYRWKNWGF